MTVLVVTALVLVAAAATVVVFTREPLRQSLVLSVLGFALTLLFLVLQAPDVALSQLVIGVVAVPLMVMLTMAKIRGGDR